MTICIEWGQSLGSEYVAYPIPEEGDVQGMEFEGPAGPNCTHVGGHNGIKGRCSGTVWFQGRARLPVSEGVDWTVEQEDPLTLSPSVVCDCGFQHGFVREGLWVPA